MKPSVVLTALSFAICLTACQETRDEVTSPLSESDLYKTIGEEIPYETGIRWMDHYQTRLAKQGRTESATFKIPLDGLNAMLESVEDLTGVAFHYGLDESGAKHILTVPVDSSLTLWPTPSTQVIIDANTGNAIEQELAISWAQRFEAAHPDEVWFHFFGRDVFDEMKTISHLQALDLEPALDEENILQLLLVVWDDETSAGGRTQLSLARIFDASNACPPCAIRSTR